MRKLTVFNQVSLDGYFTDAKGDMSWAHKSDPEWDAFVADNARNSGSSLLLGRVTYELMASFWPTAQAKQSAPEVADGINGMSKIVFSRTLKEATWNNTRLVSSGLVEEVRSLKKANGKAITILGSGSIVSQLAEAGLIDEYHVVVNPLVLAKGRTMFDGISKKIPLKLVRARPFENGNVVLSYELGLRS